MGRHNTLHLILILRTHFADWIGFRIGSVPFPPWTVGSCRIICSQATLDDFDRKHRLRQNTLKRVKPTSPAVEQTPFANEHKKENYQRGRPPHEAEPIGP